jgi:hypothetical protein
MDHSLSRRKSALALRSRHRCRFGSSAQFARILARDFEKTAAKEFRFDAEADATESTTGERMPRRERQLSPPWRRAIPTMVLPLARFGWWRPKTSPRRSDTAISTPFVSALVRHAVTFNGTKNIVKTHAGVEDPAKTENQA